MVIGFLRSAHLLLTIPNEQILPCISGVAYVLYVYVYVPCRFQTIPFFSLSSYLSIFFSILLKLGDARSLLLSHGLFFSVLRLSIDKWKSAGKTGKKKVPFLYSALPKGAVVLGYYSLPIYDSFRPAVSLTLRYVLSIFELGGVSLEKRSVLHSKDVMRRAKTVLDVF